MNKYIKYGTFSFLFFVISVQAYTANSNSIRYCDHVFVHSHFTDVEQKDYPQCIQRWQYLANSYKAAMRDGEMKARKNLHL